MLKILGPVGRSRPTSPPARGKRSHPDGDHPPAATGKRLQTRGQAHHDRIASAQTNPPTGQPATGQQLQVQAQVNFHPGQTAVANPAQASQVPTASVHIQSVQEEVHILSVGQHDTSTPFQPVKN